MESGTKYRNHLLPPISPCSSPMLHEIKVEKDCDFNSHHQHRDHHQEQQQRPNTLSAATTCFIDESLTSLDWLIELDINQLTTVPHTIQNRGCRDGECNALSLGEICCCDDVNCNLPETDRRSSDWATRHYSGLSRKPAYSYPELIFMAMQDAPNNQITVAGIYSWIKEKFPYYRNHSNKTWQNSVRHCLSLNSCFERVSGSKEQSGKGAWRLSPEFLSNKRLKHDDMLKKSNKFMLEQGFGSGANRFRASYHPYHPDAPSIHSRGRQITIRLSPKKETDRKNFGSTDSDLSFTSCSSNLYGQVAKRAGSVSSSPLSSSADDTCIFDGVVDSFDYHSGGDTNFNCMDYDEKSDLKLLSEFLVISPQKEESPSAGYLDDSHPAMDGHTSDSSSGGDVMSMMMMSVEECTDLLDENIMDLNLALGSSTTSNVHHGRSPVFESSATSNPNQVHDLSVNSVNSSGWFDMVENCDLEGFVSNCLTNL